MNYQCDWLFLIGEFWVIGSKFDWNQLGHHKEFWNIRFIRLYEWKYSVLMLMKRHGTCLCKIILINKSNNRTLVIYRRIVLITSTDKNDEICIFNVWLLVSLISFFPILLFLCLSPIFTFCNLSLTKHIIRETK